MYVHPHLYKDVMKAFEIAESELKAKNEPNKLLKKICQPDYDPSLDVTKYFTIDSLNGSLDK